MDSARPIVVVGATGHTGRRIVARLQELGAECLVAARRPRGFARERGLPFAEIRLDDPASLDRALHGAAAVVSAVGPYLEVGEPVVAAAVRNGVPYLDISAEQPFLQRVRGRWHDRAVAAGVPLLPGHGTDFAFAFAAAGVLQERCGPLEELTVYLDLGEFEPSRGTLRSMVGLMGEELFAWRDGPDALWSAGKVQLPGEPVPRSTAPFAGGEAALLPAAMPTLRTVSTHLALSGLEAAAVHAAISAQGFGRGLLARWQGALKRRVSAAEPAEAAPWRMWVRGRGLRAGWVRLAGTDTYGDTAVVASDLAVRLAAGSGRPGVWPAGAVWSGAELLDGLDRAGVSWSFEAEGAWALPQPGIAVASEALVDASPDAVWALLSEEDWSSWNDTFVSMTGERRVGGKGRLLFEAEGRRFPVAVQFCAVTDARELAWTGGAPGIRGRHAFRLTPEGSGTRIRHEEVFRGPLAGAMRPALGLMRERYRSVTEQLAAAAGRRVAAGG